jgi:hypothetical protein
MPFIDRGPLEAQPSLCGPPGPGAFTRGDVNGDRFVDLSDSLLVLFVLFQNTVVDCPDAADTNDDGVLGLTDVLGVLDFLFLNGAPPAPPFPAAGEDLTGDELGCDRQAA